jgi:hypothetical protein
MCRKGAAMRKALLIASCRHKHANPAKNFIIADETLWKLCSSLLQQRAAARFLSDAALS